jgi:hypothetical protein
MLVSIRGSETPTILDDDVYPKFSSRKLFMNAKGYVMVWEDSRHQPIHRVIMNAPKSLQVDHINGNKLDNRKENLRLCTNGQNKHNMGVQKNNKTGYKGVYPFHGKFGAKLKVNKVPFFLGYHDTAEDAARAYDRAATKYCGEFAKLNFDSSNKEMI